MKYSTHIRWRRAALARAVPARTRSFSQFFTVEKHALRASARRPRHLPLRHVWRRSFLGRRHRPTSRALPARLNGGVGPGLVAGRRARRRAQGGCRRPAPLAAARPRARQSRPRRIPRSRSNYSNSMPSSASPASSTNAAASRRWAFNARSVIPPSTIPSLPGIGHRPRRLGQSRSQRRRDRRARAAARVGRRAARQPMSPPCGPF